MRIPTRAWAVLLIICLAPELAACGGALDAKDDATTQAVFDQIRRHDLVAVEARLPPRLRTAVTDARLQVEARLIPDGPPQSTRLVDFNIQATPDGRQVSVRREYLYPDRLLVVSTSVRDRAGQPSEVARFGIQPFDRAALAGGKFSLAGKSSAQYFMLALAGLIPLLLIYALARLALDKTARWKWVWTPFILIGFMRLSVNWATGVLLFQPFSLIVLGAAVARGPLDVSPWIVSIGLPIGALAYLGRAWFAPAADEAD